MGFNPSIPQTGDFVSKSQKDILKNFQEISSQFSNDHVLSDEDDQTQGKHRRVNFNEQTVDPVTAANEVAFYTKDTGGQPELYFAPESAATVKKVTRSGVWQPGLKVEASVTFDHQGNIIEENDPTVEGGKRKLQNNIASVVPALALPPSGINLADDWIITYTNNISTADYFWVIGWQGFPTNAILRQIRPVVVQPFQTALYNNSVSASTIRITGYQLSSTVSDKKSIARIARVNLIIYTVG